jgi:PKD repeat protein
MTKQVILVWTGPDITRPRHIRGLRRNTRTIVDSRFLEVPEFTLKASDTSVVLDLDDKSIISQGPNVSALGIAAAQARSVATLPDAPVAEFSSNIRQGAVSLAVQFTDESTNQPESWLWDFGDGGTSTAQNPLYSYTSPDAYEVTLSSTNAGGTRNEAKFDHILAVSSPGDGRPGPDTTGLTSPDILSPFSGRFDTSSDGQLIENLHIIGGGGLLVTHDGVTIRNCIIDGDNVLYCLWITTGGSPGAPTTIEDCELTNGLAAGIKGHDVVARRLNIHNCEDGFKMDDNCTLTDSWVHQNAFAPATDGDGVQIRSGSNFVITGNYFDVPGANHSGRPNNSAVIIDASGAGPTDDVLVDSNWMNGGNFTIYNRDINETGSATNVVITNNIFGSEYNFGIFNEDTSPASTRTGNVLEGGSDAGINNG